MKLTNYKVLSFDCYGTLIDWETGIINAYRPLVAKYSKPLTRDAILETHARHDDDQEAKTPQMLYSQLLGVVYSRVAKEWGIDTTVEETSRFSNPVHNWPA